MSDLIMPVAKVTAQVDLEDIKAGLEKEDIVKVVRCKDCVCWDTSWKPTRAIEGAYWCSNNDIYTEAYDYCSFGERKES